MDGEWVETRMRKMIYGDVLLKVKHPGLMKKASVKCEPWIIIQQIVKL
jgi:hypothetical protein